MFTKTPSINIPLSLEQIVFGLKQLSADDLERLEMMVDTKFQKTVASRSKTAWQQYQKGKTIPLEKLQREFK